jgi:histidinol-phosphate aminotransferase
MPGPAPRPSILSIQAYVGGKAEVAGRSDVAKLSSNESPLGPSPRAIEAYQAIAASLHRYPDGGSFRLREALGAFAGRDPARLVCGAGSDELISLMLLAYAGPGDEVIHSAHGFLMYRISALAVGATPVSVPEADLHASVDAILERVTERTRLVFLANPNNPTGTYLPTAEIARLQAGLPEHVLLVLDAAYAEYVERPDYDDGFALVDRAPNVVVLRTFSKIMGLAALRLGWCYAPAAVVDVLNRVRGPFNVTAAAQAAGIAALGDGEHLARSRAHNDRWLAWLTAELVGLGFALTPSVGNFVLVRTGSLERAAAMLQALETGGVLARAMGAYGLPDCVRISVGLEADNRRVVELAAALDRQRVA